MILSLWNYLRGYVIIEVTGFSVERFVNLAVRKGVYIWDFQYAESAASKRGQLDKAALDVSSPVATMKVSVKGFKLLKGCAKKAGCKVRIRSKIGAPFYAFRYRKRKILLLGGLFFICVLYFLSSFVWLIDLSGVKRIEKDAILAFCSNEGLKLGALKSSVNTNDIENKLLAAFSDISWINIYIKGTRASITLTEIIPKQQPIDKTTPCNIVAKKDGLITKIATSAGTPLVKQKDVVRAGDVLVSSELIIKNDETGTLKAYTHAEAQIWAKLYYNINFTLPYTYSVKSYTGNKKKLYSFQILGKNIGLFNTGISYESYDKIISRNQLRLNENYPLPIIIITTEYREFRPVEKRYTIAEAKELADRMVTGRIIREFDFDTDIMDKAIEYTEAPEELIVNAVITTIERIDEQVPFNPNPAPPPAETPVSEAPQPANQPVQNTNAAPAEN